MTARPRVLCVDDDPMVLASLAASLRKRFEVVTALGGPAAIAVLERDADVRVVLSDYRMPGMDGQEFLSLVRERFPTTTRILLSGGGAENEGLTDEHGLVFRSLAKPCQRETLIRAIEEALHGSPA